MRLCRAWVFWAADDAQEHYITKFAFTFWAGHVLSEASTEQSRFELYADH